MRNDPDDGIEEDFDAVQNAAADTLPTRTPTPARYLDAFGEHTTSDNAELAPEGVATTERSERDDKGERPATEESLPKKRKAK
jgi:hypothetical protein